MAFNDEEVKGIKITAEVALTDAECDRQKLPHGSVQTVVWVDHLTTPVEVEWSPGLERGWVRWAPLGADLPTIP